MKRSWLFTLLVVTVALFVGGVRLCRSYTDADTEAAEAQSYLKLIQRTRTAEDSSPSCTTFSIYRADPARSSIVYVEGYDPACGGDGTSTLYTVERGRVVERIFACEGCGYGSVDALQARLRTLPKRRLAVTANTYYTSWTVRSTYWIG